MGSWQQPPLPARLAASHRAPFVGRRIELGTFDQVWDRVLSRERHTVFVGGEPGGGKTRLVAEIAATLHDHGMTVLLGSCTAEFPVPYQPFSEAFERLFEDAPPTALADIVAETGDQLRLLTDAVDRQLPAKSGGVGSEGSEDRQALFDATAGLLVEVSRHQPLVLVLEDLHWARPPTLDLLSHVVQRSDDARLLVLATHRTTEPDRSDALSHTIADLYRLEGTRRVDLGGLDADDITDYLVAHSGLSRRNARGPAAILRDQTGGNPFFMRELWRELGGPGASEALRRPDRAIPASVRDTLHRRLAGLDPTTVEVVELAAVLGQRFELPELAEAAEVAPDAVLAALDDVVAAGIVEVGPEVPPTYVFSHELARQTILDQLAPSRRTLLHARVGTAIEHVAKEDAQTAQRLAHHFTCAQVLGHLEQAVRYSRQAARHASRSLAHEEAAFWYERAAGLARGDQHEQLVLAGADARRFAGDHRLARQAYATLTDSANPDTALQAAIGFEDAARWTALDEKHAADLLISTLDRIDPDPVNPLHVRARASLARALCFGGELATGRELGDRAIVDARELDDDTLAHCLMVSLWRERTPDAVATVLDRARELTELASRIHHYGALHEAASFRSVAAYILGEPHDVDLGVEDAANTAPTTGRIGFSFVAGCLQWARLFMDGAFAQADRRAARNREIGEDLDPGSTDGTYGMQMFMTRRETGALEDVRGLVPSPDDLDGRWLPGQLALYTELGMHTAASDLLRRLLAENLDPQSRRAEWPAVLVFLVEAALALGDDTAITRLRPLVADYDGMNLLCGHFVAVFGSANRLLGRIASNVGDDAAADQHFEKALAMDTAMRSSVHEAETLAAHAIHLASSDDIGRRAQATTLADRACWLAERTGQRRVLAQLAARDLAGDPPDEDGLTEREIEVLTLVAAGLSNRAIGEELFISPNTAANHVRSILAKTGASNRTQAATHAAQRGLLS